MFRFYDFIRLAVVTPPLLASGKVKRGLALFSVLAAVPIVPVNRQVVPNEGRLILRGRCHTIAFGRPIYPPSINSTRAIKPSVQELSHILEESLSELHTVLAPPG